MSEQNKCRTCAYHKRKVRMGEIVSTCTLRATKRSTIDDEMIDPDSVCDRYTPKQSNIILGYKGGFGTISED